MESGFFMGSDLNRERDNLWFTLLFKRPRWFAEVATKDPGQIRTAMRIMEKAMVGGGGLDSFELSLCLAGGSRNGFPGS